MTDFHMRSLEIGLGVSSLAMEHWKPWLMNFCRF